MLKWIQKRKNKKGFTLVELVVVIAILGILAALAVPKLMGSRKNAAITAHNANVRTLEGAANLAVADGAGAVVWDKDTNEVDDAGKKGWSGFMQKWPEVPAGLDGEETIVWKDVDGTYKATTGTMGTTEAYRVEISTNGGVTVTPGAIVKP